MSYSWVIVFDYIAEPSAKRGTNQNAAGLVGPRSAELTGPQIAQHPESKRFRMKDDDGELYYEGFLLGGDGFEPLDDFGMPNAGATSIELLEDGEWKPV